MIPACFREDLTHVDADGTKWVFRPKTGAHERKFMDVAKSLTEECTQDQRTETLDTLFREVVLSAERFGTVVTTEQLIDGMPFAERIACIMDVWMVANRLTAEEKKD